MLRTGRTYLRTAVILYAPPAPPTSHWKWRGVRGGIKNVRKGSRICLLIRYFLYYTVKNLRTTIQMKYDMSFSKQSEKLLPTTDTLYMHLRGVNYHFLHQKPNWIFQSVIARLTARRNVVAATRGHYNAPMLVDMTKYV